MGVDDTAVSRLATVFEVVAVVIRPYVFESLSRTATCTRELSAFICVIPRGTDLIPPCLDYHI